MADTSFPEVPLGYGWVEPRFAMNILSAIDQEPVEDGYLHPAEEITKEALSRQPEDVISWLSCLISLHRSACVVASVLKCVARVDEHVGHGWVYQLAGDALTRQEAEVRDAAAQALELLGGPRAAKILKMHREEVPWLRDYIERVIAQLEPR